MTQPQQMFHLGKLLRFEENPTNDKRVVVVNGVREINHMRAAASTLTAEQLAERQRLDKLKHDGESNMMNVVTNLVDSELKFSRINKLKLLSDWRVIMRIAKIDELRKLIELYFQNFERDLDNKDAILQMLDKDIEEAEDHYSIALRNHFIHIKQLTSLQDSRITGLFKEFTLDVEELEREFEKETSQIRNNFDEEKKEIFNMLDVINEEFEKKKSTIESGSKAFKTDLLNKIADKNMKLQEKIKKMADLEVNRFNNEINDIKAKSKDQSKRDDENIEKLKDLDKKIDLQGKKVTKLSDQLKTLKMKIKTNYEDWESRNTSLELEKTKIMESYKLLKQKMIQFRNGQREKMKKLVKNSWDCKLKLESYIKLSEKILKLAEICRTLETEKEKILPYYENSDTNQEEYALPETEKIEGIQAEFYEEIESLQQFWKRYNKVKLDVIAIKRQKTEYIKQNEILRTLLQQYYDGFTVNHVVMSNENPLLRIERTADLKNPSEENSGKTLQEAGVIYSDTVKQYTYNVMK